MYSNSLESLVQTRGKFTIRLKTSKETSSTELFENEQITFQKNSVNTCFISLNEPIDNTYPIESIFITFTKTSNIFSSWLYYSQWSFRYVDVLNGESQILTRFCPSNNILESGQVVEFKKC